MADAVRRARPAEFTATTDQHRAPLGGLCSGSQVAAVGAGAERSIAASLNWTGRRDLRISRRRRSRHGDRCRRL